MEQQMDLMADLVQKISGELRTGLQPAYKNFLGFFHAIDWNLEDKFCFSCIKQCVKVVSNKVSKQLSYVKCLLCKNDAEKLYKKLTRVKSGSISRQKSKRDGVLGMFGKNVDVADHYQKKLDKLEDDMRLKQSLLAGEEVPEIVQLQEDLKDAEI